MQATKEPFAKHWQEQDAVSNFTIYKRALETCIDRVRANLSAFTYKFPSACGVNDAYLSTENADDLLCSDWTSGFWSGMVWLCYELTGDEQFKEVGLEHVKSFRNRLDRDIMLDHHDIGFLYTLSCTAAYKLTGDSFARETALMAAKKLSGRFREIPGIIQRGGNLNDPNDQHTGAFIIDCCLNIPLLYWAAQATGEQRYHEMAYRHIKNVQRCMILPDASCYQYFKLDIHTGEPIGGSTPQGANEPGCCWSRGQAWGMYGFAISYAYNGDTSLLESADRMSRYFLNRVQSDGICNWDFLYRSDDDQRDTSASAIAVCGMLELAKQLPLCEKARHIYENASLSILRTLIEHYMYTEEESPNAILRGGVYALRSNRGVNEPTIWGDYFFMEALVRVTRYFQMYW